MMLRPYSPRSYQLEAIDHLLDLPRNALWMSMGMGKTLCTLTVLDMLMLVEDRPSLVLAPKLVAETTWPAEAKKWAHLRNVEVVPVIGSSKQKLDALKRPGSVYATNYESIPLLVEHYGGKWPFRTIVSDESTRLKGFRSRQGSIRAKALARVAHSRASRFIELSGTPAPNGLQDLWGPTWFLDRGKRLGSSFTAFSNRWFRAVRVGDNEYATKLEPLPHAAEEIQGLLSDLCLTIDAKDHFDIEQPIVTEVRVDLPAKARALYDKMEREFFIELEQGKTSEAVNSASKSSKCLQIAAGAVYTDEGNSAFAEVHDAKIQALDSIIEEAAGAPVLVAYFWKHDLIRLKRAFPQGVELSSDVLPAWGAGKIPIMFAHPQSAGHGLNLQDGGYILAFFSEWWNLEYSQQILERIGPTRQAQAGHPRPVFVYRIIANDTVDEVVLVRQTGKATLQDILMAYMKRKRKRP